MKEKSENLFRKIQQCDIASQKGIIEIETQKKRSFDIVNEVKQMFENGKGFISEIKKIHEQSNILKDKMQKQCSSFEKIVKDKSKVLDSLTEKIENLLPGATSAGLASSYRSARKEKNTKCYWFGFLGSLIVLCGGYFYYLIATGSGIDWLDVVVRTVVGMPLVWIAWYCQRSISQTNKIKEEYHHKQRMMSVFDGFSKYVSELTKDDPEQNKLKKLELISAVIDAIKKNPSEILNPSETFLDSLERKKKTSQNNRNNSGESVNHA